MINTLKRRFFVGDEWLYYKIYCGYKTSDTVLIEIIKPFTENLIKDGYIEKWFFIRYADPNNHIRFRIKLIDKKNIGYIIHNFNNLLQDYINSKSIWSLQIDCYDREIERYGLAIMELAEDVFFNDSTEIINFLSIPTNDDNALSKISKPIFSLKLIDSYLNNFKLSDFQKLKFIETLRNSFYKEFEINKENKKQIEKVYIEHKDSIYNELLNHSNSIINIEIKKNLEKILNITSRDLIEENKLTYLISSFIHMSLNRLYYSNNRIHELVCYDLLWRFYKFKINKRN
ncbi:thiopeptide-type bacteriocin biosynthesis protein [Flavobacterium sp. PS2]|uniref:thiopeptide-type bacteriocin biosynthesis protein n=1 Tax=Flavobacterium sp. PS2 TaxID=3384157 RepID=UPI00390CA8A0